MFITQRPPDGRGCGDRDEGKTYACCGAAEAGMPIEDFVIDPAIPWPGKFQRGVKILPRDPEEPEGLQDLAVFVGRKYYPSPWDYVEETRLFGASRKLSPSLPFGKLTPGESRMVFVHSLVIPDFEYELEREERPLHGCKHFQKWVDKGIFSQEPPERHLNESLCTFALRDLTYLVHGDIAPNELVPHYYDVIMPSFSYSAKYPRVPAAYMPTRGKWKTGIFLALPLTHFEFCRTANEETKDKIEQAGFRTEVLEW